MYLHLNTLIPDILSPVINPMRLKTSIITFWVGKNAVHAAMAGKTDFVAGQLNNLFALLPISFSVSQKKKIDIEDELWLNGLETTDQLVLKKN
jgi:6-phosphofructokinase 1